jgi:DNA polymerase (family X)
VLDKSAIAAHLREIASLLELRGGNKFKARAFVRGARALEATREPVGALIEGNRLLELPGIGVALARQIEELFRTGKSELLESLREGLPSGVLELSAVGGVGLHALRALSKELGIATVEDLKTAAQEGRLRTVKGFGEKKEKKILAAIAKYETRGPTILLADGLRLATELESAIESALEDVPGAKAVHLAGSLRRSAELSSDVDLVVETDHPNDAVERIAAMPRIASVERRASDECRLRLADGTRVDVAACKSSELPSTLLHAIASPAHLAKLQTKAEERGLRLEPNGLFRDGRRVPLRDEAQLYEKLGLSWVPPEMREDIGEIELAEAGDPFDLVTEADIRGFTHCHSTWSDGKHSILEMARAAEKRGASFITITDHSSNAHYAGGLDVERIQRQWEEIDEVQEQVKIKIFRGTEADILADGAIDWPDRILERLDVVIASIHNRYRQDEAKMTERVLRAMRHPLFKIWGHPMGRLVTSRPPIPLRVEEVLDALAESHGAIEINGDPYRLDLEPKWARAARERGIPFVLSVDAHSMRELGNVRYAAGLARRAGIHREEVLNTRSAAAFSKAVSPASSSERAGRNSYSAGRSRSSFPRAARAASRSRDT